MENETVQDNIKNGESKPKEHPGVAELLSSFQVLLDMRKVWIGKLADHPREVVVDMKKLASGMSLAEQQDLIFADDPLDELACAASLAIAEAFPLLSVDMKELAELINEGQLKVYRQLLPAEPKDLEKLARETGVSLSAVKILGWLIASTVLCRRAQEAADGIVGFKWDKGVCPVCASPPMISIVREKKGGRFLQCSLCASEWVYPVLRCPSCASEEPGDSKFFFVEDEINNKVYTCDNCGKYLISFNRPQEIFKADPTVLAVSHAYLDLIAQEKGYEPICSCLWNKF